MVQGAERERVTVEQVEELLAQIPGIISTRVLVNDWGGVEDIHVLATMDRHPKYIVRDVQAALSARWGLQINHKKIGVAQVVSRDASLSPQRLGLTRVEVSADMLRGSARVKVSLGRGTEAEDAPVETYTGEAEGLNARHHLMRLAVEATLEAVNLAVDPEVRFAREEVALFSLNRRDVALVTVTMLSGRGGDETVVGAVMVKGDPVEASVRAALDAVNRRLTRLTRRLPRGVEENAEQEVAIGADGEPGVSGGEGTTDLG